MLRLFILLVATCAASPALGHTGSVSGGFAGGLSHPLFGPDHVAAMVAVGLWGAFLGPPAIYILPVVFPLVMAFGGVLGILGVPLPGVEIGIAVSAAVLGMVVALAARPPLWVAGLIVGAFAVVHGHAHGTELPPGADALGHLLRRAFRGEGRRGSPSHRDGAKPQPDWHHSDPPRALRWTEPDAVGAARRAGQCAEDFVAEG